MKTKKAFQNIVTIFKINSIDSDDGLWKVIHQFQPGTKTLIRKLKRILKLYQQNVSLSFNKTHPHKIFTYIHFAK